MTPELIVTLIVGIASPVATVLVSMISIRNKQKQILTMSLRTTIQGIYAMYREKAEMPTEVYHGMCDMYDQYVGELKQNSYIKTLKTEMDRWRRF